MVFGLDSQIDRTKIWAIELLLIKSNIYLYFKNLLTNIETFLL